jgi:hypothetical protein
MPRSSTSDPFKSDGGADRNAAPRPSTAETSRPDGKTARSIERRSEERTELHALCEAWTFNSVGDRERLAVVSVRSYSFRGVSIIVKRSCPLSRGQAIEVTLASTQGTQHAAGTVAHCRAVGADQYEIGIHVRAVGSYAILSGDLDAKKALYRWFEEALRHGGAPLPSDDATHPNHAP